MAYRLLPNGTIETDTVAELRALQGAGTTESVPAAPWRPTKTLEPLCRKLASSPHGISGEDLAVGTTWDILGIAQRISRLRQREAHGRDDVVRSVMGGFGATKSATYYPGPRLLAWFATEAKP
jgi:hypothetical protein